MSSSLTGIEMLTIDATVRTLPRTVYEGVQSSSHCASLDANSSSGE